MICLTESESDVNHSAYTTEIHTRSQELERAANPSAPNSYHCSPVARARPTESSCHAKAPSRLVRAPCSAYLLTGTEPSQSFEICAMGWRARPIPSLPFGTKEGMISPVPLTTPSETKAHVELTKRVAESKIP